MTTVISVQNVSKKYLIDHERTAHYETFAERFTQFGKRFLKQGFSGGMQTKEEFWALRDVSFDVGLGDKVGIIGRNGAGKSTLLKILSRITEPTNGQIGINGRVASLLEVGTGFHPELTGRENIYLNGAILGMSRKDIRQRFDEIVDFAEVEKFLDTPVKRYSSGMYVRLAFAVAAHLEPEILIVDEVLAVGDALFQKKCLGKMGEVGDEGRTLLFVSHNMNAVEQICKSILHLRGGEVAAYSGEIWQVIHSYFDSANETKIRWDNLKNLFPNEHFTPCSFFASVSGSNRAANGVFSASEVIEIQVQGEIRKLDDELQIGIAIYDERNELVFRSFNTDIEESRWPRFVLGENTVKVCIPSHFLNEGSYRVELLAALYYRVWLLEPMTDTPMIFFKILGGLSVSPHWLSRRPGMTAPVLEWSAN